MTLDPTRGVVKYSAEHSYQSDELAPPRLKLVMGMAN